MTDMKTFVVLSATGNQGGSVVDSFLLDGQWNVRGVTRNTNSDKAKNLASRGVEVVAADLAMESLSKRPLLAPTQFLSSATVGASTETRPMLRNPHKASL